MQSMMCHGPKNKAGKLRRLGILGLVSLQSRQVSLTFAPEAWQGGGRVDFRPLERRTSRARVQALAQSIQDLTIFENLQRLPAKVNRKASYGLWVDVNGPGGEEATGLIHLSEMDQELDSFRVGQEVMVDVVYVEPARGHLGLSMQTRSWSTSSSSYRQEVQEVQPTDVYACEWLQATVAGVSDEKEGVFVELERPSLPKSGFVSADLIDLPRRDLKRFFKAGDPVHVRVLGKSTGMLQLSMKGGAEDIKADLEAQLRSWRHLEASSLMSKDYAEEPLKERQDLSPFATLKTSEWLKGHVVQSASYGIYVSVQPPQGGDSCWGLVHLSEFSDEKEMKKVAPGAEVQVRVIAVDQPNGRLFLSAKEGADSDSMASGEWLNGTVEQVHSYGLTLQTPAGRGLLYLTEFKDYIEDPVSKFACGDTLRVRVLDDLMEEDLLAFSMKTPEVAQSKEIPPFEEEEPLPNAQDLQIRAMRQRLKDYLGISPQEPLTAQVQAETPFGLLLDVAHPDGKEPSQGLLVGPSEELRTGQQLQVKLLSVDTHRGVLMVGRG